MPYFDEELQQALRGVEQWADLRYEQGVAVGAVIGRVRRELEAAERTLRNARVPRPLRELEPNDLEAIQALRPRGPRRLWGRLQTKGLSSRMKGAWLGRAAGCTLGAPVEGWTPDSMERLARSAGAPFPPEDYWPTHPEPDRSHYDTSTIRDYLKGGVREIPVDDDLTYTVLGLLILERFGPGFSTKDIGKAWLDWLPVACTAEHVALDNLRAGVPAYRAADRNNPFIEWIGADIRSDPWGYAAPGWPERAAEMAYRDAYLSHRFNGIYGAMFFSAAIAAAFAVDDPLEALKIGLTEIPRNCRLARDLRWAFRAGPRLEDWRVARAAVDRRFAGMSSVHTNNNACLTVFALILGEKDFTKTIGMTVAMGLDNDCTAATAGSLLGAVIGIRAISPHWWKPFRNRARTYVHGHPRFSNTDLVRRFIDAARSVWDTAE